MSRSTIALRSLASEPGKIERNPHALDDWRRAMGGAWTMRRVLIGLALLLAALPAMAQTPRRVVTVNLCLDQLALRLAAPGQLVGVSYLAHDPRISVLVDRAREIAPVRATVESILALRPDLVIVDANSHANLRRLLRGAGVALLEVPWAASLEEAETLIARVASALGREPQGRALVDEMQTARRAFAWTGQPVALAAVLQPDQGTTGKGSLMDELLRMAGLRNLAAEIGLPAYGRMSLETVLAGQPDLLVLDTQGNANPARATEFIDHHALRALDGRVKIAAMPFKYAVCAGPENFEVLRRLAEARP